MTTPIIKISNLACHYKTYQRPEGFRSAIKALFHRTYQEKIALHPTSLSIKRGEVIGLVGANGAGKTTLIKLLSGLVYPTSGEAHILGYKPWERNNQFLQRIGILLGQKNQLWWDLPPMDSFLLLMRIYDLSEVKAKEWVRYLAHQLHAEKVLHTQLRRLSLGERMKMEMIGVLIHRPEVLFLDEPTIGLDIVAQKTLREFIKQISAEYSPTIILTSHYMGDIDQLASRLLLMGQGKIVYDGTVTHFSKRTHVQKKITILLKTPLLQNVMLLEKISLSKGTTQIEVEIMLEELGPLLTQIGNYSTIESLSLREENFEDVIHQFLQNNL